MCRLIGMMAIAGAIAIGTVSAQEYPSRPITMVVGAAAGGPTDTIGRMIIERMRASLGQTIIIENNGSAAGSVAHGRVARAAPDGYTVSLGHWNTHVVNGVAYSLSYDVQKDFEPIALISSNPYFFAGRRDLPVDDLKDLIAWLKANSDRATMGTSGTGNVEHVGGVLLQSIVGTNFRFIPYRGGAPKIQDLVAKQFDWTFTNPGNLPLMRDGSIKVYALAAKTRHPLAPEIPTTDEAGLPGFYLSYWHGLWAPKGTPKPIIVKLNDAVVAALADPVVRQRLADIGQDIFSRERQTSEVLGAFQKAEIDKWWPILRAANIKGE
jgi:tripartite-type tricarboxylate transporter receptor subunit TctC